jgi:hypothetical protein
MSSLTLGAEAAASSRFVVGSRTRGQLVAVFGRHGWGAPRLVVVVPAGWGRRRRRAQERRRLLLV